MLWPFAAILGCALSAALSSCAPQVSSSKDHPLDLRAERICRRIVADLPAGTLLQLQRAYGNCMREFYGKDSVTPQPTSVEASANSAPAIPGSASFSPAKPAPAASAQERYWFCRVHGDVIREASDRYSRAVNAFSSAQQTGNASWAYRQAEIELSNALEDLSRAIPFRYRQGRSLVPEAVEDFRTCNFSG